MPRQGVSWAAVGWERLTPPPLSHQSGMTALFHAAHQRTADGLKVLIEAGADKSIRDMARALHLPRPSVCSRRGRR